MEYQKVIKMLEATPNQPIKLKAKNWVGINDDSRGTYNTYCQVKFKTSMLRIRLCDYSDAYILINGTATITGAENDNAARRLDERNQGVIFKKMFVIH